MKKLLLSIATVLIVSTSFAQLKRVESNNIEVVGEAKTLMVTHATLSKVGEEHNLHFRDVQYTKLEVYKDFNIRGDIDEFYNLCVDALDNQEEIKLESHDGIIVLIPKKIMGKRLQIQYTDLSGVSSFTNIFSLKQINSLFGK